jgi:non-ribosomal peptide synthetase component E (peptide arylation enzyme)
MAHMDSRGRVGRARVAGVPWGLLAFLFEVAAGGAEAEVRRSQGGLGRGPSAVRSSRSREVREFGRGRDRSMGLPVVSEAVAKKYIDAGLWGVESLFRIVDGHRIQHPDRLAVADQSQRLSYDSFCRSARALGNWLREQGLSNGDIFALVTPNSVNIPMFHLAAAYADITFMPLSDAWREREIEHLLGLSRAKVVFVPSAPLRDGDFDFVGLAESIRSRGGHLEQVVGVHPSDRVTHDLATILAESADDDRAWPRDANDARFVMVTSGTTELPRISAWSDNNLRAFMTAYVAAADIRAGDIAVGIAPANTGATGYVFPVLGPILFGASSVLLGHWNPNLALELLAVEGATHATAVPTQIIKMLEVFERGLRPTSLRVFTNAGAPLPPQKAEELEQELDCTVQAVYGASDGGVPVMTRVDDAPEKRYATVGRPLPMTDVLLVDANLQPVAQGASGEVMWRNALKSYGYVNDSERNEEVWVGEGFYRSGDLGRFDEDGYLQIVGRVKDIIIRGGQNISPREVEEMVLLHPRVSEVAAIGLKDDVYGERVCICISLKGDGSAPTLAEICELMLTQGVAKYKLPERLEVVADLPRSAGGKIDKVALRERFGQ